MCYNLWQKGTVLDSGGSEASFPMQAYTLTKRSFVNMSRDFGYYWLRLVIYVVVTVCIGTIYLNVGTSYNSILVNDSTGPQSYDSMKTISFSTVLNKCRHSFVSNSLL